MNKDEILAKSRREAGEFDEREEKIYYKACQLSRVSVIVISAMLALLDLIIRSSSIGLYALMAVIFGMNGTENLMVGIRLKKIWRLLAGILITILTVFYLIMFIMSIV